MAVIVLRVRMVSGENMDVRYDEPSTDREDEIIDHVVVALSAQDGMLRCSHGERLVVLFARGVAAVEVAPRGAIL